MIKMKDKMRAVVKTAPGEGNTEIQEVEVPEPGPEEVLIKNKAISICGTDVHIYKWNDWADSRIDTPLIYGHEFVGNVVKTGKDIDYFEPGDYVSGECHIKCGHCYNCRTGNPHMCENTEIFGVDRTGVFSEYTTIPAENAWRTNTDIPPKFATVQDPLGNAVHTIHYAGDVVGKDVAVMGLGPIGLMAVAVLKFIGARNVIGIEHKNEYRMNIAEELGADLVLGAGDDKLEKVRALTGEKGVDATLEMSGAVPAINTGLKLLKPNGKMVLLGVYNSPAELDITNDIVFKGTEVIGVTGRRMFETWYRTEGLLEAGLDLSKIITHELDFDDFLEGMDIMVSGQCGKVILNM